MFPPSRVDPASGDRDFAKSPDLIRYRSSPTASLRILPKRPSLSRSCLRVGGSPILARNLKSSPNSWRVRRSAIAIVIPDKPAPILPSALPGRTGRPPRSPPLRSAPSAPVRRSDESRCRETEGISGGTSPGRRSPSVNNSAAPPEGCDDGSAACHRLDDHPAETARGRMLAWTTTSRLDKPPPGRRDAERTQRGRQLRTFRERSQFLE